MQPEGWAAKLINKWATVPKKHQQAELLTTVVPSVMSKLISRFWLLRPEPYNDLGRISPMKKLSLGHIFQPPGPQLSEVNTSHDFWDTVSQLNLQMWMPPFYFLGPTIMFLQINVPISNESLGRDTAGCCQPIGQPSRTHEEGSRKRSPMSLKTGLAGIHSVL